MQCFLLHFTDPLGVGSLHKINCMNIPSSLSCVDEKGKQEIAFHRNG